MPRHTHWRVVTIRYDTRCYFNVRSEPTTRQWKQEKKHKVKNGYYCYLFIYLFVYYARRQHIARHSFKDKKRQKQKKLKFRRKKIKNKSLSDWKHEIIKTWNMHQFTTVFSNDLQICSLISKSGFLYYRASKITQKYRKTVREIV